MQHTMPLEWCFAIAILTYGCFHSVMICEIVLREVIYLTVKKICTLQKNVLALAGDRWRSSCVSLCKKSEVLPHPCGYTLINEFHSK